MSSVNWSDSEVEAKPDIATDKLTFGDITIDENNAKSIKPAALVDTTHFTMNNTQENYCFGIDYSHALTNSSVEIDVSELNVDMSSLFIVLFDDEPRTFRAYFSSEDSTGGSMAGDIYISPNDEWSKISFKGETKYYWSGWVASFGAVGSVRIIRLRLDEGAESLLTVNVEDKERLVLGYSRLFLNNRKPFYGKTNITNYASAHHENSMLVLPNLTTASFKGLLYAGACKDSDLVLNLNSSLQHSSMQSFPYFIEVEGDYAIETDDDIDVYERRYEVSNDSIEHISTISRRITRGADGVKIAHIPANSVLMISGDNCLISRIQ